MMAVNAAITLQRPLLIKGEPSTGKIWDVMYKFGRDYKLIFVGDAIMSKRMFPLTLTGLERAMRQLNK